MIEIASESYDRDRDVTSVSVRFSHEDRRIQTSFSQSGRLSLEEIEQLTQQKFEEWKQRTS